MDSTLPRRAGAITFRGTPMTLVGPELHVGDPAPDFTLATGSLQAFDLDEAIDRGHRDALLVVVPSLDTAVCSRETVTFNQRIEDAPEGVAPFVVSMDLPFAQARWAASEGVERIAMLSDYRERSFGPAYGLYIEELGLLARAVVVIGKDRTIRYVQLVPEVGEEPNYDEVFAALG